MNGVLLRGGGREDESGSTSVELAIGFAAVAAMLALILAVSSIGVARQGLCRAAGEAARAAVAGAPDPEAVGRTALGGLAPRGARVSTTRTGQWALASAVMPGSGVIGVPIPPLSCEVQAKIGSLVP